MRLISHDSKNLVRDEGYYSTVSLLSTLISKQMQLVTQLVIDISTRLCILCMKTSSPAYQTSAFHSSDEKNDMSMSK